MRNHEFRWGGTAGDSSWEGIAEAGGGTEQGVGTNEFGIAAAGVEAGGVRDGTNEVGSG